MISRHTNKYIFLIMGLLTLFAIYLQYSIAESTEKLKNTEIYKAKQYAQRIAQYIQSETGAAALKSYLETHPQKRHTLNKTLHAFLTKEFQYVFLIYKDKKGHYRFLLDGTLEDPVEYNTVFFPKSKLFDRVYETQKPQIIKQSEGVEEVWLSLVYPIVKENQTQALLVMDLSKEYGDYLNDFNSPIVFIVTLMQWFLIASLIFLAYLAYSFHKLRKNILIDPVTSAYTKLYLKEFFDTRQVNRYDAMMVDIDGFKQVNDRYGYASGNRVLKQFTEEMTELLPNESRVIHIGGSEFFAVVEKGSCNLKETAEKVFKGLNKKRFLVDNEVISLTLSMSAIVTPEDAKSIDNIYRFLDEKLLKVKSRGKSGLEIIDDIEADEVRYNIDYIRNALEEQRITCLYQPIFNTETQKIDKYEALVRLIDKEDPQKLISPYYFLDTIRGTTQYIKMSKLVLNEVFNVLDKYPEIKVSINLDLDDLHNEDMLKLITKKLYRHKNIADRLTFEIVENHEIQDYDEVALVFQQLKTFGSKIAIDDFGSGYSNYNYLIRLDVDILKIDGSLIHELLTSPKRTKAVLSSLKKLSETLGYKLVAEFISSEEIYNEVRSLEIDYVQGYYLGEPKPIETYID